MLFRILLNNMKSTNHMAWIDKVWQTADIDQLTLSLMTDHNVIDHLWHFTVICHVIDDQCKNEIYHVDMFFVV